jgi:hypothetical protein
VLDAERCVGREACECAAHVDLHARRCSQRFARGRVTPAVLPVRHRVAAVTEAAGEGLLRPSAAQRAQELLGDQVHLPKVAHRNADSTHETCRRGQIRAWRSAAHLPLQ